MTHRSLASYARDEYIEQTRKAQQLAIVVAFLIGGIVGVIIGFCL